MRRGHRRERLDQPPLPLAAGQPTRGHHDRRVQGGRLGGDRPRHGVADHHDLGVDAGQLAPVVLRVGVGEDDVRVQPRHRGTDHPHLPPVLRAAGVVQVVPADCPDRRAGVRRQREVQRGPGRHEEARPHLPDRPAQQHVGEQRHVRLGRGRPEPALEPVEALPVAATVGQGAQHAYLDVGVQREARLPAPAVQADHPHRAALDELVGEVDHRAGDAAAAGDVEDEEADRLGRPSTRECHLLHRLPVSARPRDR